ncbi:MAG: GT4 family glycosyltransferase PelF [Elusimicrobiota bacterium]
MTDVCLILEGTYPFVSGGVATWIHQLITAMPDIRFSILSISPFPNPHREYKYKLPANVTDIQDVFLHDIKNRGRYSSRGDRRRTVERLREVQDKLLAGDLDVFPELLPLFRDKGKGLSFVDTFEAEETWEHLTQVYERYAEDVSFLDYFWTTRSIILPLLNTMQCSLPPARLYHVVSTGYAGLLACIAKHTQDAGVLLTEHGVYTHERLLEISQATWIYTPHRERFRVQQELSYFKRVWLGFFELLGKLTYRNADEIITLFEGNKLKQIAAGAPPEKISIIHNGIDLAYYANIPLKSQASRKKTVAFIGRVVNIKDVKTFLHMAKIVHHARPATKFLVIGPTDEEPDYTQECRDLVRTLGVEGFVSFLGKVDMKDWYSQIDLVVLTSLSEAQPYVILEASAVGIPVVATDVGACREMLEGREGDDRLLGPSGLLTGVAHPEETADAVVKLLDDPELWSAMSEAGRSRVAHFYDQDDLISKYLNIYERMMR